MLPGGSEMRELMQRSRESKPASPGLPSTLHPPLGAGSGGGKPGNGEADVLPRSLLPVGLDPCAHGSPFTELSPFQGAN